MEQRPSSEANSHLDNKEVPHLLWNPQIYYRVHKSPTLVPILNQMNPIHSMLIYFFKIHLFYYTSIYACASVVISSIQRLGPNVYIYIIAPMRAT
jgi:hypothetical protein